MQYGCHKHKITTGEVVEALHRRNIDLCCAPETKWKGECTKMIGANSRR